MSYLIALTFLLAPAYVLHFSFFGLPADVLMVWTILLWLIFLIWLVAKKQLTAFWRFFIAIDKKIIACIILFFLAGLISTFVKGLDQKKLGEFIVFFLQPISLFFIAAFVAAKNPKTYSLFPVTCYLLLAAAGIYAIFQYFTLIGLPPAWWGNSIEPKRSVAFFIHPDFYGLWCAPLLALLIPDVMQRLKDWKLGIRNWVFVAAWLAGAAGLIFSQSRAGWVGLLAAFVIYIIFAGDKKIKLLAAGILLIAVVFISATNFRYRILVPLLTHDKSVYSRLTLWQSGWEGIKQSPVLGLGLTGYSNEYKKLISDPTLPTANFPHNIFLDLWVETGLLGLVSFVSLAVIYIYGGLKNRGNIVKFSVALFLVCLLVQGQFDNPYFKNDLAMVFWIVLAMAL